MNAKAVSFRTLEIKANYTCNAGCEFCCARNMQGARSMTFDEIASNVDFFKREYGIREVCLSGGEPTIHPSFLSNIRFIRGRGLKTYLHTNAIRFADWEFAEGAAKYVDRTLVGFSFHSRESCYELTGSGNRFELRKKGIENLAALSGNLRSNTVILSSNFRSLPEISRTVRALGIRRALFTVPFFFDLKENQVRRFSLPAFSIVKPYLREAFDFLTGEGTAVYLQGVPPCRLDEFAEYREIDPDRAFVDSARQLQRHSSLFAGMLGYRRDEKCADCGYAEDCWGYPLPGSLGDLGREMGLR